MDTELKIKDCHQPCTSLKLDCSLKCGADDQERNSACQDAASGMKDLSLTEQDHQHQAGPSRDAPPLVQQFDSQTTGEAATAVEPAGGKEAPSELLSPSTLVGGSDTSEGNGVYSRGPGSTGFPETEHSGFSLESYLSDFKSSSGSDWNGLDMSGSCIDGLLGKLGSAAVSTRTPYKHGEKEDSLEDNRCPSTFCVSDALEDNRCPSTFCVSEREDSWPEKQHVGDKWPSTFCVSCVEDSQPVTNVGKAEKPGEHRSVQNLGLKAVSDPPHEADKTSEKRVKVCSVTQGSMVKEDSVSGGPPSLGFNTQMEGPEKEEICSLRSTAVSHQTVFDPSSQIISEEHLRALQLLGLTDCNVDEKEEVETPSLHTSSLSHGDSPLRQSLTRKTEVSSLCLKDQQDTDIVPFVSGDMDEGALLSTKIDSRPQVHDPDYLKDGYIFSIEDNLPTVHSGCESDMSDGSPRHTSPPFPHSHMPSTDQQAGASSGTSLEEPHVETSTLSMENTSHRDHWFAQSDFGGSCSITDVSCLGLPPKITVGKKEADKEGSVSSGVNPGAHNRPEENRSRPEPAPRRNRNNNTLNMSQTDAGNFRQQGIAERGDADTAGPPRGWMVPPRVHTQVPSPSQKRRPSDGVSQPAASSSSSFERPPSFSEVHGRSPSNIARSDMPIGRSDPQSFPSRPEVPFFAGKDRSADHSLSEEGRKQARHSQGEGSGSALTPPGQRAMLPPSTHRTELRAQNPCVFQGNPRAESSVPQSSAQAASSSPQCPPPCLSVQQPLDTTRHHHRMEADAETKTVVVKSQSLDQDQQDLCHLYFENERRSSGGDIEEEGVVWNEEQRCFFITFVDHQVARRVASRDHTLKNSPVQVQLWSPPSSSGVAVQEDRVLISGVPPSTTSDCLQNYIECVLEFDVASVLMSREDNTALVMFESPPKSIDVEGMERACQDNPLEPGRSLSFHGVPVSSTMAPAVCSIVRVTGLGPETANDAVQYFFSNKRRNAGGPVKLVVKDPGSSTAFVYFENPADAESVVNKGSHVLDGRSLCVSLHEASHSGDRTGQQGPAFPPQGTAFPPQGASFPPEVSFPGSQNSRNGPPQANMASGARAFRESPMGYQHQAGHVPVNSAIINSYSNQPKDKNDREERGPFAPNGKGPQAAEPYRGVEHSSHNPPEPGFRSEFVNARPPPRTVRMELGADVIQKIINDNTLLTKMIQEISSVQSRYQWEHPDHIVITCRRQDPDQNWESHVDEMMNRFVQPIRLQLQRERECAGQEAADNPERTSWRDANNPSANDMPSSVNSPVGSARDTQKPPSLGNMEDIITNLKPAQIKILRLPKTMEKLKRDHPGLEISVDKDQKIATVGAPETSMKKAFTDVLAFVTNVREMKIPLSPAMAQMFKKKDAEDWIQKSLVERYDLLCHWEASDDHIILSGQSSDLSRLEQMLQSVFKEASCSITEKDACLLKSPAWTSFLERMQEMDRGGCPTPVLLPEETQIIIVDTPSKLSETRLALTTFLEKNKPEKEELPMNPNHVRFFRQYFKEESKAIRRKAMDVGVSVTFSNATMVAEGPKDSLAESIGEVRELVGKIKEDKMTFKTPGEVRYLKGSKGQEFLAQTGTTTGCYITTNSGDGVSSDEAEGQLLAKVSLDANHQVLIVQGDITQCVVDAIVNAANTRLSHDGGVALAIAKAGGESIQEESDQFIATHGQLHDGDVAVTGPGSLKCRNVLHAVGPTWKGGYKGEDDLLKRTVTKTLKKAETMGLTSVAIPAISCGIFSYPVEQATEVIMRAISSYFTESESSCCIRNLILIDIGADPLHGFLNAAKMLFGKRVEVTGKPKKAWARSGSHHHGGSPSHEHRYDRDSKSDNGHGGRSHAPIKIISGDIARSKADVIVCTTHPSGDLKKGVLSKSILDRGGDVVQQDLRKYIEQQRQMELGKPAWTSPGDLDCKAVYHLSLPTWRDDHGQKMRSAVTECLDAAAKKKSQSIAFPTLGTGKLGYPGDKVASIMFSAVEEWFQRNSRSSMKEVQIIVFNRDTETLQAFKAAEKGDRSSQGSDSYSGDRHSGDRHSPDRHSGDRHSGDRHSGDRHSGGGGGRHGGDRHGGGGHRGDRHGGDGRHRGGHSASRGRGHSDRGGDFSGSMKGLKTMVGKVVVMVKEGNILTEPCDAIVNSNNDNLDLSFGLSKEIGKICGEDLVTECRAQRDKMKENGVAITKVDSPKLSCASVIHVSADRYKRNWQDGILAALQAADKEGMTSVSLPALGTGGRSADPVALAEAMQRAVSKFSNRPHTLQEVRVVVFQKALLAPYTAAFDPGAATGGGRESDDYDSGYDMGEKSDGGRGGRKTEHRLDVHIYSTKQSGITEARKNIHEHVKSAFVSKTETDPLIANFSTKQLEDIFRLQNKHNVEIILELNKSSITITGEGENVSEARISLKDLILSVTKEHHREAGMPPVRWQYESGKDKFTDFDREQIILIEAAFKRKDSKVQFSDTRGRKYKIVFKDRKEYPVDHPGHPVAVKRRDMLEEKKHEMPLPTHWAPMKGDKVKRVELKPDSGEYKRVAEHFGGQAPVKKVERIQNPTLFQQFKVKKTELEQYNPKGTENEKRLFHGTSSDSVDSIITNGFNRSYCGKNGTALGNGVYFAADSSTSMGYAAQGGQMFQARVLVGEYTQGNSGMRMAPNKPSSNRPYDSVANASQGASVFVIFHDAQAYPEYLISF